MEPKQEPKMVSLKSELTDYARVENLRQGYVYPKSRFQPIIEALKDFFITAGFWLYFVGIMLIAIVALTLFLMIFGLSLTAITDRIFG